MTITPTRETVRPRRGRHRRRSENAVAIAITAAVQIALTASRRVSRQGERPEQAAAPRT